MMTMANGVGGAHSTREFEVFFDGDCPLCTREISWLKRLDRRGRIRFTDIASRNFDAAALGVAHDQLMRQIHGRTAAGDWVVGVEVFRHLYEAVGFGVLVSATRLPIVRQGLDALYDVFAKHRLSLTGRCDDQCRPT